MGMDLNKITVDRDYSLILKDEGSVYDDALSGMVEKLIEARERNEISDVEFKMYTSLVIQKMIKKDIEKLVSQVRPKSRKKSLLFAYTELKKNYAF